MYSSLRQKACLACAVSKRRCDKQLPECQRCLARDVPCTYPQHIRPQGEIFDYDTQAEEQNAIQSGTTARTLGTILGFEPWAELGSYNLDVSISDVLTPCILTPSGSHVDLAAGRVPLDNNGTGGSSLPWFLQDETWAVQRVSKQSDCVIDIEAELRSFVRSVDEMLQFWINNGYNSFIHQRLYENGMPTCIQDAFTTLAAYTSRTSAVEEAILQIAEQRSTTLIRDSLSMASGQPELAAQLARVQALFVFQFIRLFNGSIRVRAAAEKHVPILRRWVIQMWEAAKDYRGDTSFADHYHLNESEFDREYEACSKLWRLWILTESVRRTHVVVESVINVYDALTKGWAECSGAAMITARHGLWEAKSALEWHEKCCAKPPLMLPSLQPGPVISQCPAEDIDDFVKIVWAVIVGSEKIQYWNSKNKKLR